MALFRSRSGQQQVLAARSDRCQQLRAARDRLAVGIDLRSGRRGEQAGQAGAVQAGADRRRRRSLRRHRDLAGGCHRSGQRRDDLAVRSRVLQGRQAGQRRLSASGGLTLVRHAVGRPRAFAHLHRHSRSQAGRARCQDRRNGRRLRRGWHGRSAARERRKVLRASDQLAKPHSQLSGGRGRQHHHRRLDRSRWRDPPGRPARARSWLRRRQRRAQVDLPHHSPGGGGSESRPGRTSHGATPATPTCGA